MAPLVVHVDGTREASTVETKAVEAKTIDTQLKKTVKTAKGDTWEITVTYNESADIPDGAELSSRYLTPGFFQGGGSKRKRGATGSSRYILQYCRR